MTNNQIMALARISQFNAEIAGMQAENAFRTEVGQGIAYCQDAFDIASDRAMKEVQAWLKADEVGR